LEKPAKIRADHFLQFVIEECRRAGINVDAVAVLSEGEEKEKNPGSRLKQPGFLDLATKRN
jgi:hypothetical protein